MKDGSVRPADLIVLATGYEGQAAAARRILGDAVGERIGRVWGFDEEGELHGMWRPTGQKGLWFHRRRAGAVPHLLEGARAADQGAGARHHRINPTLKPPLPPPAKGRMVSRTDEGREGIRAPRDAQLRDQDPRPTHPCLGASPAIKAKWPPPSTSSPASTGRWPSLPKRPRTSSPPAYRCASAIPTSQRSSRRVRDWATGWGLVLGNTVGVLDADYTGPVSDQRLEQERPRQPAHHRPSGRTHSADAVPPHPAPQLPGRRRVLPEHRAGLRRLRLNGLRMRKGRGPGVQVLPAFRLCTGHPPPCSLPRPAGPIPPLRKCHADTKRFRRLRSLRRGRPCGVRLNAQTQPAPTAGIIGRSSRPPT